MPRRKRHLVRARIQSSLFAASRATGRIFVIDANSLEVKNEFQVGSRPDGLAHDPNRKNFLVADVADSNARLFHIQTGEITGTTRLRGRSRWTFFDKKTDRFLVNFRDPVEFALLHN
jgi:DNA-binding beta-propeller fold protein YncE